MLYSIANYLLHLYNNLSDIDQVLCMCAAPEYETYYFNSSNLISI